MREINATEPLEIAYARNFYLFKGAVEITSGNYYSNIPLTYIEIET
ncbi:hypothetical protein [Helicobacter felis]|uniref:Uncharacterized protein n=1 Tax=Helicobacter felis (strain ATCC 49179 / CCUG 28539 / NCTC 12436 / CS1) TaxID=936155 RepID=E7A8S4_HELFC|nr:hypothetical protein [Helicobacter felis]CBY83205.1 unnamed protein product [Helicobacter felis ATCC 49179]